MTSIAVTLNSASDEPTEEPLHDVMVSRAGASLPELVCSEEPTVVFASLARSSAEYFSDTCTLTMSEGTNPMFDVLYPLTRETGDPSHPPSMTFHVETTAQHTIAISFDVPAGHGWKACAGVVVFGWKTRTATTTDAVIGRLLVDRAVSLLQYERLVQVALAADRRSAQLTHEAITSHTIGEAVGLLSAARGLTSGEGAALLKKVSRQSGREVYDVAIEVVQKDDEQRCFDQGTPAGSTTLPSTTGGQLYGSGHLRPVATEQGAT